MMLLLGPPVLSAYKSKNIAISDSMHFVQKYMWLYFVLSGAYLRFTIFEFGLSF